MKCSSHGSSSEIPIAGKEKVIEGQQFSYDLIGGNNAHMKALHTNKHTTNLRQNTNCNYDSNNPYKDIVSGTQIYQSKTGSYLPDSQQPKPANPSIYKPHTSTRYKNVIIGINGLAKMYSPNEKTIIDTDKPLPELYNIRESCCGCTACYAICPVRTMLQNEGKGSTGSFGEKYILPHGAIYMEEDEEGFLYPVVDASLCIRCYKCINVCPVTM